MSVYNFVSKIETIDLFYLDSINSIPCEYNMQYRLGILGVISCSNDYNY